MTAASEHHIALVAGARGFIGRPLCRALRASGARVVEMSRPDGDVTDPAAWERLLDGVDVVYHLAAYEQPPGPRVDPSEDWRVNAGSVLHLIRACLDRASRPRIIFASSTNLVGCPATNPIDERTPDDPLTIFATNKAAAEGYLRYYAREHGLASVTLRLANVYGSSGESQPDERVVVNRMIARAMRGEPLKVFANGNCVRDFLHVDDAVSAFVAAAALPPNGEARKYVVGSGEATRLVDLVELIAKKRHTQITHDDTTRLSAVEWRNLVVDSSRLRADTGWTPAVTLAAGIDRTIEGRP